MSGKKRTNRVLTQAIFLYTDSFVRGKPFQEGLIHVSRAWEKPDRPVRRLDYRQANRYTAVTEASTQSFIGPQDRDTTRGISPVSGT